MLQNNFAENSNRSFTLHIQRKSKRGKWVTIEKLYSKFGYTPNDYKKKYIKYSSEYPNDRIRILNSMYKQVYSETSLVLDNLFDNGVLFDNGLIDCDSLSKINIKYSNDSYSFCVESDDKKTRIISVLNYLRSVHGSFKKIIKMRHTENDNHLRWFKVFFEDGNRVHIAFFK